MSLALTAAQDGPVPYTAASPTSQQLYSGPPVRPYEPSWDTPEAEGDAYMVTRRALEAPVVLTVLFWVVLFASGRVSL